MMKFILLIIIYLSSGFSKKIVLLPYYSVLCQNSSDRLWDRFREYTINQQVNIETNPDVTWASKIIENSTYPKSITNNFQWMLTEKNETIQFACRIMIKPVGRKIEGHMENGSYNFWNIRARIDRNNKNKCSGHLLLQFRHRDNLVATLDGHSAKTHNVSCSSFSPQLVNSTFRKLYLTYFTPLPPSDSTVASSGSGFILNITSFIFFQGKFSLEYKRDFCQRQDGFWCPNNSTATCIFREMICDGYDSCFDGGSDEAICVNGSSSINGSGSNIGTRRNGSNESGGLRDYLPWLALGLLPLFLLMVLVCICNQQRNDVYFDDAPLADGNMELVDGMLPPDIEKSLVLEEDEMELGDVDDDKLWTGIASDDNDLDNDMNLPVGQLNLQNKEAFNNSDEIEETAPRSGPNPADIINSASDFSITKSDKNGYEDINHEANTESLAVSTLNCSPKKSVVSNSFPTIHQPFLSKAPLPDTKNLSNIMSMSQMTEDDYDNLEDVGSLLRKVDQNKIPEDVRQSIEKVPSPNRNSNHIEMKPLTQADLPADPEYRADYILV